MDEPQSPHPSQPEEQSKAAKNAQLPLWPPDLSSADAVSIPVPLPPAPPVVPPSVPPTKDPPWTLSDLGAFLAFVVFSFFLVNIVIALGFHLLAQALRWETSLEEAIGQTPFVVTMQVCWELLWLVFIYFLVARKYRRRFWEALKWVREPARMTYLAGGVALAVAAQLQVHIFPSGKDLPIEQLFTSTESVYLLAVFGVFVAPFVEEVVFRGFIYPVFEKRWGFAAAVLLTAGLFAGIHVPQLIGGWQEIAVIFAVGIVFSYFRGKTGSLVPPFLMHLGYNACLFFALFVSTDGFRNLGE